MPSLPTVISITCPTCGAKPGGKCVSRTSGNQALHSHVARSRAFRTLLRNGARFVVLMRHDVPEHGLKKGQKYLAHILWQDRKTVRLNSVSSSKRTVDCLQPGTAVRFVEWES